LKSLETQLKSQENFIPIDELEILLRRYVVHEEDSIRMLENDPEINPHKQEFLAIHHKNLELYQEMLSGVRPYAPVPLIIEIMDIRKSIDDIDTTLTSLQDNNNVDYV
jgi:hypothetical protein